MNTVDDRIAAALRARAGSITEADLAPAVPPSGRVSPLTRDRVSPLTRDRVGPLARGRWTVPLLAAAVAGILAFATVTVVQLNRPTGHPAAPVPQPSVSPRPAPPTTVAPTPSGAPIRPTPSQPPSSVAPAPSQPFVLGYEPLWPFASYAEAEQWRTTQQGGPLSYRLDAAQVALEFTGGLGFPETETFEVTGTRLDKLGAHVGVGWRDPDGQLHTAAVLHLVRYGSAKDSPWEVVGSDDTTLSLEQPAYGSRVTSPMTVGGHITGVDENVVVVVAQRENPAAMSTTPFARVPAGGDHAAWTTGPRSLADRGVLIIVASTGGHLRQVERFAIQGVHT